MTENNSIPTNGPLLKNYLYPNSSETTSLKKELFEETKTETRESSSIPSKKEFMIAFHTQFNIDEKVEIFKALQTNDPLNVKDQIFHESSKEVKKALFPLLNPEARTTYLTPLNYKLQNTDLFLGLSEEKQLETFNYLNDTKKKLLMNQNTVISSPSLSENVKTSWATEQMSNELDPQNLGVWGLVFTPKLSDEIFDLFKSFSSENQDKVTKKVLINLGPEKNAHVLDALAEKGYVGTTYKLFSESKDPVFFKNINPQTRAKCISQDLAASSESCIYKPEEYANLFASSSHPEFSNAVFQNLPLEQQRQLFVLNPTSIFETSRFSETLLLKLIKNQKISIEAHVKLINLLGSTYYQREYFKVLNETDQAKVYAILSDNERIWSPIRNPDWIADIHTKMDPDSILRNLNSTQYRNSQKRKIFDKLDEATQRDIYFKLGSEARKKLYLTGDQVFKFVKDSSTETIKEALNSLSLNKEKNAFFNKLPLETRLQVRDLLSEEEKETLIKALFKPAMLASKIVTEYLPFDSLSKINKWISSVTTSGRTMKGVLCNLTMTEESPQVKNYNEQNYCDSQRIAREQCTFAKIKEVFISCSEAANSEDNLFSYDGELPRLNQNLPFACTIKITPAQQKNGVLLANFNLPQDNDALMNFAIKSMPPLNPQKEYTTSPSEFSYENLKKFAQNPGLLFQGEYFANTTVKNKAYEMFFPLNDCDQLSEKRSSKYSQATVGGGISEYELYSLGKRIDHPADGKTLTAKVVESISELGRNFSAFVGLTSDDSGIAPKEVEYIETDNGRKVLTSNNLIYPFNWQVAYVNAGYRKNLLNNALVLEEGTQPHETPETNSYLPPLLNGAGHSTLQRASDLVLFYVLPAVLSIDVMFRAKQFITSLVRNPKKTTGQKISGTVGTVGLLATIAYVYNSFLRTKSMGLF